MEHDRIKQRQFALAASNLWIDDMDLWLQRRTGHSFTLLTNKDELIPENLQAIQPEYIFFPHWSHIIPEPIHQGFNCVIFHMTDVPYGRGGSPLQNLISRGCHQTKISAIKCIRQVDAGPVYLKKDLALHGSAEEIYIRATRIIMKMIVTIIESNPIPHPQEGPPVLFSRRTPEQSDISDLQGIEALFDHIRMLDAPGYPRACFEFNSFQFELSRASLAKDSIVATVKIRTKKEKGRL